MILRRSAAVLAGMALLLLALSGLITSSARGLELPGNLPSYFFIQSKDENTSLSGFLRWPLDIVNSTSSQNTTERVLNFGFDHPATPATFSGSRLYFSYARHFASKDWDCVELSQGTCRTDSSSGYSTRLDMAIMELRARRIFEFVDSNDDGNFTVSEPIVKELRISDLAHSSVQAAGMSLSGATVNLEFLMTSQIPTWHTELGSGDPLWESLSAIRFWVSTEGDVRFTFSVVVPLRPFTLGEVGPVRPPDVKIEFVIGGMNFSGTDTSVALDLEVVAYNNSFEFRSGVDSAGIYGNARLGLAYFNWTNKVVVDGLQRQAGARVRLESPSTAIIILSYPRGQLISHDPILGVRETALSVAVPILEFISPLGLYVTLALGIASIIAIERRLEGRSRAK